MTKIVHCKKEKYDVYIGRPSKWGNPFTVGKDGTRNDVIIKYENWLLQQPHLLKDLYQLKDKILGCWCKPEKCHGDILIKYLNKRDSLFIKLRSIDFSKVKPSPHNINKRYYK